MGKIISVFGVVLLLFTLLGCRQETFVEQFQFTFANEASFDTTITASIDGSKVYEKELISYVTAGGYFGQEFEYKLINVTLETGNSFVLEVEETTTGYKQSSVINPANGKFIDVTFWGDKLIITQSVEEQVRFD